MIVVLLAPVPWSPPGVDLGSWRQALAEDVVDLLATLSEVEPAIAATAADRALADAVAWPSMRVYEVLPEPTVNAAFAAAAADGFEQAAVIAADAPDVPGLVLGKLLRPLTTRTGGGGARRAGGRPAGRGLPAAGAGLAADRSTSTATLRRSLRKAAPQPNEVATTPAWRRLRGPADLATLDPAVEGWDATRLLLTAGA